MQGPELIFTRSAAEAFQKYCSLNSISKAIILCDDNTRKYCLPLLGNVSFEIIQISAGEENKNFRSLEQILNALSNTGALRDYKLINLGGGMVCDIGGFAASIYMRGIPFVNIPTTLLAMVDAAIGGKTGIDLNNLKNIVGTFTQAEAVIISPEFLNTLEADEIRSAWSEIIKTACICDPSLFEKIVSESDLSEIIKHCASTKQAIVSEDFKDNNKRQLLNFGHTFGHAYESFRLELKDPVKHGFAVAKGMLIEIGIAKQLGILDKASAERMIELIRNKVMIDPISDLEFEGLFKFLYSDKKNIGQGITFSLPHAVGSGMYGIKLQPEELKNWKSQGFI